MKTFSIFAVALLFAGAANAQIASPVIGSAIAPNALFLPSGQVGLINLTRNVSVIDQVGTRQHAVVTQIGDQNGTTRQNEASLLQIAPSAGTGNNNATQTQTNNATGGGAVAPNGRAANRMEGEQRGVSSTMSQIQVGSGNLASGFQRAGSSGNLMTQTQTGVGNQVYSSQAGSSSRSAQFQDGQRNQGVVIQTSPAPGNLAIQTQTGNDNRAYASQGTSGGGGIGIFQTGYNNSNQVQVGSFNFVRTDQFGSDDRSTVTQRGTSNSAQVVQQ